MYTKKKNKMHRLPNRCAAILWSAYNVIYGVNVCLASRCNERKMKEKKKLKKNRNQNHNSFAKTKLGDNFNNLRLFPLPHPY